MPDPTVILASSRELANEWRALALGWHVVFAVVLVALAIGWEPRKRALAALTLLPFLTVMNLAWRSGNAFTALVLLACTAALAVVASQFGDERVSPGSRIELALGKLLILTGWVYPHFLDGGSWTRYLYEAPLGVVPCATLAFAAGISIAAGGFASRGWSLIMAAATAYYGLVGVLVLGVTLDLVLVAAAVALLVQAASGFAAEESAPPREFSHGHHGHSRGTA